jgi:type VI secretion system secreted protein Hcp
MAISAYMWFQGYDGKYLESESQVDLSKDPQKSVVHYPANSNLFEIEDYSFDVEQTLNIGGQSSGTGAGKISFHPIHITRKTDKASPIFFQMACSGTAFQSVVLALRKSAGGATSGEIFLKFTFKLVAVKTIAWAQSDEAPKETVTFEYGGMVIEYWQQKPDGSMGTKVVDGWNRVKNIADHDPAGIIPK